MRGGGNDQACADADGLVSPEVAQKICQTLAKQQPDEFLVLLENWPAVQIFLDCVSCWREGPFGLGFDYAAVDVVVRRGGYEPLESETWQRLQTLERVAAKALSEDR